MIVGLLFIAAYLLGAVPFGYLVAKSRGVDITQKGSGNIGATNVGRVLGRGPGLLVFLLDVGKGYVPAHFFGAMAAVPPNGWAQTDLNAALGVTAVFGHAYSIFLKFRGGKGIATGLGAILGVSPLVGAIGFGTFLLLAALSGYVSLASLVAGLVQPVFSGLLGFPISVTVMTGLMFLFVIWTHRANIERLRRGEEPRKFLRKREET